MKILIGLDGSEKSEISIQEAVSRPWPTGSQFSLLTAVDPYFFERAPFLLAEATKNTREQLEEDAARLKSAGWETTTNVLMENLCQAIPNLQPSGRRT